MCSSGEGDAGRRQTWRTERFAVSFHELPAVWQLRFLSPLIPVRGESRMGLCPRVVYNMHLEVQL